MEEQRENKTTPIQSPQLSGFTLQQVIAIIDSRLANLEKLSVTSDDESKEQYLYTTKNGRGKKSKKKNF